jgi:hypothetical protein
MSIVELVNDVFNSISKAQTKAELEKILDDLELRKYQPSEAQYPKIPFDLTPEDLNVLKRQRII